MCYHLFVALADQNNKTRAARGAPDAYSTQVPSRNPSVSAPISVTTSVDVNAMSSTTAPASPASLLRSNSLQKPSSPSSTLAARSFGFASDRSPLQKLELELKHISKEESDAPSLGRSLSKRQEERLQRSTTITSRLTSSPTNPSSSRGRTKVEDYEPHNYNNFESNPHRYKMAHVLGHRSQLKDKSIEKEGDRDDHRDIPPYAEDISKLPNISPIRQAPITGSDRVGQKARHHHHGYQFQHIRPQDSSNSNSSKENPVRVAQAAGGEGIFEGKIAHLTLEDGELDNIEFTHGGDAAEDDGMKNLLQEGSHSVACLDNLYRFGYPSPYLSSTRSSIPRKLSEAPAVHDSAANDFSNRNALENTMDGYFSASEFKRTVSAQRISPSIITPPNVKAAGSTCISQNKEGKKSELILSFIGAIPRRPVAATTSFSPPLNVKCGPLLRYTGLSKYRGSSRESLTKEGRETWRGSVMIVTTDDLSDYSPQPIIRLFFQPIPESDVGDTDEDAAANAKTMTTAEGQKSVGLADEFPEGKDVYNDQHMTKNVQDTQKLKDGEKLGKYREIEATKLHAERGVTFWRFVIEVELGDRQTRIAYRINHGPSIPFWVPARGETMNIMFHSCNGFSLTVNPDDFCGPDPLWKDVLREHQKKPFHVMLGGGDQSKLSPTSVKMG